MKNRINTVPTELEACCDLTLPRIAMADVVLTPDTEQENLTWATAADRHLIVAVACDGHIDAETRVPAVVGVPPENTGGRYPKTHKVIPEVGNDIAITLDCKLLLKAARAIGEENRLTLFVPLPGDQAVLLDGPAGIGALMPCAPAVDEAERRERFSKRRSRYIAARRKAENGTDKTSGQ